MLPVRAATGKHTHTPPPHPPGRREGRRNGGSAAKSFLKRPGSAAARWDPSSSGERPCEAATENRARRGKPRGGGTVSSSPSRDRGLPGPGFGKGEDRLGWGRGCGTQARSSAPRCPRLHDGGGRRRRTPHGSAREDRLASTYLCTCPGPPQGPHPTPGEPSRLSRSSPPRSPAGAGGDSTPPGFGLGSGGGPAAPGCGSLGGLRCEGGGPPAFRPSRRTRCGSYTESLPGQQLPL